MAINRRTSVYMAEVPSGSWSILDTMIDQLPVERAGAIAEKDRVVVMFRVADDEQAIQVAAVACRGLGDYTLSTGLGAHKRTIPTS